MDITTTELADAVCGGVFDAGPERCLAASRAGIPALIVPGCVDMANFWSLDTVPEKYKDRNLYQWNPNVTLLRTNVEENIEIISSNYRVAPGVGLRISVPALGPAPLAIDFAFPVAKATTDDTQVFSFFFGFGR